MREIKFRAWDKEEKCRAYPYSFWVHPFDGIQLKSVWVKDVSFQKGHESIIGDSDDYILMQYTGLKDKNGTDSFHFDIVLQGNFRWVIEWGENEGGWILTKRKGDRLFHKALTSLMHFEIIGNTMENPELLEKIK